MKEEFKDIEGFGGVYKVSNKGYVLSERTNRFGEVVKRVLKPSYATNTPVISIRLGNKVGSFQVHRLVYQYFIGDLPEYKQYYVTFKDGDCHNSSVENLTLGSVAERNIKNRKHLKPKAKPIWVMDMATKKIKQFIGQQAVADYFEVSKSLVAKVATKRGIAKAFMILEEDK